MSTTSNFPFKQQTIIRIISFYLAAIFVASCSEGNAENSDKVLQLQKELDSTKAELRRSSEELTKLKNSPEQRTIRGEMLFAEGKLEVAKDEFQGIVDHYDGTPQAKVAKKKVSEIEDILNKRKAEEERKKALGYKILKPESNVDFNGLKVKFERVWSGENWSFDDHGRRYSYRSATRGNTHILARVSITSEDKDPALPPVLVYEMKEGLLHYLGTLGYEFRRWKDYGTYLGNHADYGNDFAHSSTIPFNLGLETATEKVRSNNIHIVVKKVGCFTRSNRGYGNPEIAYTEGVCNEKKTLSLEDFERDYVLIKRL